MSIMELPNIEDIYDYDTPKLESVNALLQEQLKLITDPKQLKKANKILSYIATELQERIQTDQTINYFINHKEEDEIIKPGIPHPPSHIESKNEVHEISAHNQLWKNDSISASTSSQLGDYTNKNTEYKNDVNTYKKEDELKPILYHKPPLNKSKAQKKKIATQLQHKIQNPPKQKQEDTTSATMACVFTSGKPVFSNRNLNKKKEKKSANLNSSVVQQKRSTSISVNTRSTIIKEGNKPSHQNKLIEKEPTKTKKAHKGKESSTGKDKTSKKADINLNQNRNECDNIEHITEKPISVEILPEKTNSDSMLPSILPKENKTIENCSIKESGAQPNHDNSNLDKDRHININKNESISVTKSSEVRIPTKDINDKQTENIDQKASFSMISPSLNTQINDAKNPLNENKLHSSIEKDNQIKCNLATKESSQTIADSKLTNQCLNSVAIPSSTDSELTKCVNVVNEATGIRYIETNKKCSVLETNKEISKNEDTSKPAVSIQINQKNETSVSKADTLNIGKEQNNNTAKIIEENSNHIDKIPNKKEYNPNIIDNFKYTNDTIPLLNKGGDANINITKSAEISSNHIENIQNQVDNSINSNAFNKKEPIDNVLINKNIEQLEDNHESNNSDEQDGNENEEYENSISQHSKEMNSKIKEIMGKANELDRIANNTLRKPVEVVKKGNGIIENINPMQIRKEIEESKERLKSKVKEESKAVEVKQAKKKAAKKEPKKEKKEESIVDYSDYYKTFAEIFCGVLIGDKKIDPSQLIQETLNSYHNFNSIMDPQLLFKYKIEQAPLEKMASDILMPNTEMQVVKENCEKELLDTNVVKERLLRAQQYKKSNEEDTLLYKVIKDHEEVYDIVTRAFNRKRRWNEMPHGLTLKNTWNLLWTWSKPNVDTHKLFAWQKVNHFPDIKFMSRKDQLKRHFDRVCKISKRAQAEFNIVPTSYLLPKEYVNFVEEFSKAQSPEEIKKNIWIMKPCASSRGRGITVITSINEVVYSDPMIIQKYITNPLLLGGLKFDLRIYVCITSVNPLEAFLYKEGFARVSTEKFSIEPKDIKNKFVHLTNTSIQQHSEVLPESLDAVFGGTKLSLESLRTKLQFKGIKFEEIWVQVQEIIIKSFVACMTDMERNPCCFELLGFDIMIDENLKCWLIEVNSSPSLGRMNLLDDIVKQKLIDDTIDLINPIDYDRKRVEEVMLKRAKGKESNLDKASINRDIGYILHNQVERKYGELPKFMGNYERIAPSPILDRVLHSINKV